ncbi:hypothetical protein COU56_05210 [Candidatus Pacearchaeota archaeon CG10_big_fil_rev_8_21_14_0_10_31_9]|nr:MAG: hypothetical protein COU56_05210 [Candidatus Pacearchaeota archaeon CG10_big_fil_rev_8_21_14_0_10_31_9]
MENNKEIVEIRKEKIVDFSRKNKFLSILIILAVISFIFSFLAKFSINIPLLSSYYSILGGLNWFLLGTALVISSLLVYYYKGKFFAYPLLVWVVWISVYIRSLNITRLKDITTNTWTLGPDLDPFLFLRWAKYIVENGMLISVDMMRYVPLGYNTARELKMVPYLIALFHEILSKLPGSIIKFLPGNPSEISITYSAILMPVFMFALTVIAFFFLTKEIFIDQFKNKKYPYLIALVASFFLSVLPPLLPRTIAGIPEKESVAFFFMFLSFYAFLKAWKSKKIIHRVALSILAGLSTGCMAITWGGYNYIFLILLISVAIAFLLGQVKREHILTYGLWLLFSFTLMVPFSSRYQSLGLLIAITTGSAVALGLTMTIHELIFRTKLKELYEKRFSKIPKELFTLVIVILLGITASLVIYGPSWIVGEINNVISNLVKPAVSRLIQTVAENRQPFFSEWAYEFGPVIFKIPIFFWLFFIGSIYLFYTTLSKFDKKDRIILTSSYTIFLIAIIFSRYNGNSVLNGTNSTSLLLYTLGFVVLLASVAYYYFKYYNNSDKKSIIKEINFSMIFVLAFFFFAIISARGAVRLIMVLVPITSIIVAFFIASMVEKAGKENKGKNYLIASVFLVLILSFAGLQFYQASASQASIYAPSYYNYQWERAMSWVRESTPENAVFGHWWDYGYWLQSIGERATILDGGNAISYWNHLMGRYVLTSSSDDDALEFLYSHNATHYLIDSTEIGKYGAYSLIGSNPSLDRQSFIPTIVLDQKQSRETKDGMMYVYSTGVSLDEDILLEGNNTQIITKENSGIVAFTVEESNGNLMQPKAVIISQGKQISLGLRYVYYNGELKDFGNGIDAGLFLMDAYNQNNNQLSMVKRGAGFYLSPRTVHSFLARKYLFGEEGNFKLAHSEPSEVVSLLRSQEINVSDYIYFQSNFFGPIKIWEINYPSNIKVNEDYLKTSYPDEIKF